MTMTEDSTVPLPSTTRLPDDKIIDHVAVSLAVHGRRPIRLTERERAEADRQLLANSASAA